MPIRTIPVLVAGCLLAACSQPPPRLAAAAPSPVPTTPAASAAPMPAPTPPAHAALRAEFGQCIEAAAGVTPSTQACIEAEAVYQQARMDKALAQARARDGATLDREQAAWRAGTDRDCAWDAATEGQGQRLDANMCALQAVADRAEVLERRSQSKE